MENNLIACFANDTAGVILLAIDEEFLVETVDEDGDCLAYARVDNLQTAWYYFDRQKQELVA